jgi:hypothetical protein
LANASIDIVARQTNYLTAKFEDGDIGEEEGNEAKQRAHIVRIIGDYLRSPFNHDRSYKQKPEMHQGRIITHNYILQRCYTLPAFKPKPRIAVEQTLKSLVEADDLMAVPSKFMLDTFGTTAKAYQVRVRSTFGLVQFFESSRE